MERDRAWLLTPPGAGAIAVIRFAGPGVRHLMAARFSKPLKAGRCVHGALRDTRGEIIDDPVIVLMDDQTADVNLHGGGAVARAVLAMAERAGFRLEAPPLDPTVGDALQQELHAALPLATTRLGLSMLLAQPAAWAQQRWTRASASTALDDRSLWWLLHPPTVALIGRANVGKSTLANKLFGQDRSIVFDQPGTTRDYVSDLANLDGLPVHLIDTPGQRTTEDEIEQAAIESSQAIIDRADLRILVLDSTQAIEDQHELIERYPADSRTMTVVSKCDLPARWTPSDSWMGVSALRETDMLQLIRAIRNRFLASSIETNRARWWTLRQVELLKRIAGSN